MSEEFTGLIPDTAEQFAERMAEAIPLPAACYAADREETRLDGIPSWMVRDDQGQRNACAAHGGTNVLEKLVYMKTGQATQLSRQFMYVEGQRAAGMRVGDNGCPLFGIIKAAKTKGCPRETFAPYAGWTTTFSKEAYEDAQNWLLTHTIDLRAGYPAWRALLGMDIGGVLMASRWGIETKNGYAYRYRPTGNGGHAYAGLFLAKTTDAQGRPDIWGLNSHMGNFILKFSATFIEELAGRDEFGNMGLTDMKTPAPRLVDYRLEENSFYE